MILLIAIGVVGLVSLIVSSRAADDILYWGGLAAFILAVTCLFVVIDRSDEHSEE